MERLIDDRVSEYIKKKKKKKGIMQKKTTSQ